MYRHVHTKNASRKIATPLRRGLVVSSLLAELRVVRSNPARADFIDFIELCKYFFCPGVVVYKRFFKRLPGWGANPGTFFDFVYFLIPSLYR
jgi:hypothetical protein